MKVKPKRSYCNYLLPYKSSPSCRPKTTVITMENLQPEKIAEKQTEDVANNDNIYVFHPGMVPPSRQMFYQVHYDVTFAWVFCLVVHNSEADKNIS